MRHCRRQEQKWHWPYFIQKLFSKKDCLFFSLLGSHFTTLHQLRIFCWVYEEVFLKMTYTSYHSSYSCEEARSLLIKLVNVTLGKQQSDHHSILWVTETCIVFQAEMVRCSMGLVKCHTSTVLTLSAERFVKSILLNPSYDLSTPATGIKSSIM